jgi:hypothetical protein
MKKGLLCRNFPQSKTLKQAYVGQKSGISLQKARKEIKRILRLRWRQIGVNITAWFCLTAGCDE